MAYKELLRLSVDRNALRAFVFVLILSLKKASEKSKGFGALGGLKFNLLVKTGIMFPLDAIWLRTTAF